MKNERIEIIDVLRGFALIGILFANIPGIARMNLDTAADIQMYRFIGLAFEQRFFPIFSFLFGLGFFIFMQNSERRRAPAYKQMARRLGLLIIFGILHQFMQPGEALLVYGIFGFSLFPLYKRSEKTVLLATVITLFLGILITEYFSVLAMFYLGVLIGKIGYFETLDKYRRPTQIIWFITILAIAPTLWFQQYFLEPNFSTSYFFTWQNISGLSIAVAMVTSIILLWPKAKDWLIPLSAFGRTALTNYILQSVFVLLISLAFGGRGSLSYSAIPFIWISIFPIQIIASNIWLRHFNYGPLEWLWRWGTYGKKPSLRRP